MKKIIGFVGSPRMEGNTARLVEQVLRGAADAGAETRLVFLNELNIRGCQGCYACRPEGNCAQQDDMQALYPAIADADAIVIGSPNYMWQITAQTKALLDRFCAFMKADFTCRLAPGKKLALVFTQGNPDPKAYAGYYQSVNASLQFFGFTSPTAPLVAVGLDAPDAASHDAALLDAAHAIGKQLVAENGK